MVGAFFSLCIGVESNKVACAVSAVIGLVIQMVSCCVVDVCHHLHLSIVDRLCSTEVGQWLATLVLYLDISSASKGGRCPSKFDIYSIQARKRE